MNYFSICQFMINELLEEEVTQKAGVRYKREKPPYERYSRSGFDPGSVCIGDQRPKIDVTRLYDNDRVKNTLLDRNEDLLCVIDGSKGIRKAIEESFGNKAVM
jgi:hypothetical protein